MPHAHRRRCVVPVCRANLAWVEGYGGDGVEVTLEAFPESKPLHSWRLEREVQERVLYLQRNQRGWFNSWVNCGVDPRKIRLPHNIARASYGGERIRSGSSHQYVLVLQERFYSAPNGSSL